MSENEIPGDSTEEKAVTTPADISTDEDVTIPSEQSENSSEENVNSESVEQSADNSLDFDEILKVPSTKEERGGKSRREWAKDNSKEAETEEVTEEESEVSDEVMAKLEEKITNQLIEKFGDKFSILDEVNNQKKVNAEQAMKDSFTDTLESKGISVKDFNDKHKAEFLEKRDEFITAGLDPNKAVSIALDVVTAKYETTKQIEESENRTNGRTRARVTPHSTIPTTNVNVTQNQLAAMTQADYNQTMADVEKGTTKIV